MSPSRFERGSGDATGDDARTIAFAIATEMAQRFAWRGANEGFCLEGSWVKNSSQNTFYELSMLPAGERIVIKVETGQSPTASVEQTAQAMADLADALGPIGPGVAGLRALGWIESPPALASTYVEGVDLVDLLRGEEHPIWTGDDTPLSAVEHAGMALAAFHEFRNLDDADQIARVRSSVARLARVLALPPRVASALVREATRASSVGREYRDFGPGNVRVSHGGPVYILDPPVEERHGPRHADIAYFEFEVRKNLAGQVTGQRAQAANASAAEIVVAFGNGYQAVSGFDPERGNARALVLAFQAKRAVVMVRKRIRQRRWRSAAWALRSGLVLRRLAIRAIRAT